MKKYDTPEVEISIFKAESIMQISGVDSGVLGEDDMDSINFGS